MKTLLCIDGNSILNRAFYGIRLLTAKDGTPTNALYGMINIFSKQIEEYKPDFAAVAFDLKAPTFRHTMYDAYKAGRKPMPEELALQLPVAKDLMRALGYTVIEKEGYEADDVLGTLASMCEDADAEAEVLGVEVDYVERAHGNALALNDKAHLLGGVEVVALLLNKLRDALQR